ncbi:MAG: TIGR02281 family clan AA aspartic protease [Gammaproteobacteria bacterium]|nr:TIGR02281 family clan AA aspartic protease [Gammaproteobacteria bacterium]
MRKFAIGLMIFLAGWTLSRIVYQYLDSHQTAHLQTVNSTPVRTAKSDHPTAVKPPVSGAVDDIADLLRRNEFEAVVQRYESAQDNAGGAVAANTRLQILAYARELIAAQHFRSVELLLQRFLVASYRDVDASILLAEVYLGEDNFSAAIDKIYEARGDAIDPVNLLRINSRIRSMVTEISQSLEATGKHNALLTLYQQLTQLEPDYAPWFIGLASAQLALADNEAARRSLLLVAQDMNVGAQARAMLAELTVALSDAAGAGSQDAVSEVAGIPLQRHGNHFIVDARQKGGGNIRLLIDTGASMTILTPGALEQAGLHYQNTGRSAVFNTANGPVRAPVYTLDSLAVGDWQVNQLKIGVLDLAGGSNIDGLLGMNFLRHFQFFIDQNEALLRLSVN